MHFISYEISSSHFLDFENLHGHNFKVKVFFEKEVEFNEKIFFDLCKNLDHKILIPKNSKKFKIHEKDENFEIEVNDKKYFFPKVDVVMLPIEDTTVELIAQCMCNELKNKNINVKKIILEESDESMAILTL